MNQKKKELEQNELANALGDRLEKLKPHAFLLGVIGIGVVGAIILFAWLMSTNRSIESSRWQEFFLANSAPAQSLPDPRNLENVANDNEGTVVAAIALLRSADIDSLNALRRSSQDETELTAFLRRAKKNYQQVVDSTAKIDPLWKRRALHGLAFACESLGEFSEAKTHYQQLVDEAKGTPIYDKALDGLNRVSDVSAATTLLTGFQSWKPKFAPGPNELPPRPQIDFPTDEELHSDTPALQPSQFGNEENTNEGDNAGDNPPTPPAGNDKKDEGEEKATDGNESNEGQSDDSKKVD